MRLPFLLIYVKLFRCEKNIKLSARQRIIADQCEILIRGFARVGIVALVDEATGYQYERERFELEKILNAYISDEILKWQLTFTDDFIEKYIDYGNFHLYLSTLKTNHLLLEN